MILIDVCVLLVKPDAKNREEEQTVPCVAALPSAAFRTQELQPLQTKLLTAAATFIQTRDACLNLPFHVVMIMGSFLDTGVPRTRPRLAGFGGGGAGKWPDVGARLLHQRAGL